MKHEGVTIVQVVRRMEVLPYWPSYSLWIKHLNTCTHGCGTTMPVNGQELAVLCVAGLAVQEDYSNALRAQSAMAALN